MYAIVKNVCIITFVPYTPDLNYSKDVFLQQRPQWCLPYGLLQWWKIFFNQNKKKIAINNDKTSGRRGVKTLSSTINGGKSSLLVYIGEQIFQTTCMAMYMMKIKNNRIKIWKF